MTVVKLDQICQIYFFASSLWNQQNFHSSYFWQHLIAWSASTLWQNNCKTWCPLKNNFCRVHSYCNLNFKIVKWKVKINAAYGDVYPTSWWCEPLREVFLTSWSGCFCGAFKLFSQWFKQKAGLYLTSIGRKQLEYFTLEVTWHKI